MDNKAFALDGVSEKAQHTASRYLKKMASQYESKRVGTLKWDGEERKVKEFLNRTMADASILDIPCGTGRFFPFYHKRRLNVIGMDVSPDMVNEAKKRATTNIQVKHGSIFNIETDQVFDVILCIRFLNLIEADDLKRAFKEMQRVGKRIIFTLRVRQPNPTGHYHHSHSISLIEESLLPGWEINRNDPVHEEDYRMIEVSNEMD